MNVQFDTVAVVGVGLLGGSLGLALKQRGLAGHIHGVGHRESSLHQAMDVGALTPPLWGFEEREKLMLFY